MRLHKKAEEGEHAMYQKIHTKMPWADMDVTQVNREAPHSQWGAYATKEEAFTFTIRK